VVRETVKRLEVRVARLEAAVGVAELLEADTAVAAATS